MFLYWRKRGAYELETLPSSLTGLGMERYSWSSPLDVIYDVYDEKHAQDEECVVCQHPDCSERRHASKVRDSLLSEDCWEISASQWRVVLVL
ncbi:hypothetical protein QQF64_021345 [Cirrhinus molitorella]|uniref:Uncharacterized protein n=1 Tax=Cirrhinus molitorella TaxID=172907 RepID=A0ABR3LBR1_9TELE